VTDRAGPEAGVVRVNSSLAWRPLLAIGASVVSFALLIERAGFVPAVVATVLVASVGAGTLSTRQALVLAIVVAGVMALLFVGLLDQPFTLLAGLR
jgi:Tripartite tricarboxylate transporter TctB family